MLKSMRIQTLPGKRSTLTCPADDAKNVLDEFVHTVARGSQGPGESCATLNGSANVQEGDDIVIAVMGPTGSGKSTFVCSASGQEHISGVGHDLKSFTDQVTPVKFWDQASGRHVVLVDTPGFDDTLKSDFDILSMISQWLVSSYSQGKLLSGILYLHRITDNRMAGTPLKNLQLFKKLCGKDALDKVHLTTTMWDEVDEVVGERRLNELKADYWKSMINHGAQTARCRGDNDSAKYLLQQIILADKSKGNDVSEETRASKVAIAVNAEDEMKKVLQIQKEMVDKKKELKETSAGKLLYSQLDALAEKRMAALRRLVNEIEKKAAMNEDIFAELQRELDDLQSQMDDTMRQMEELKLPWFRRFRFRK